MEVTFDYWTNLCSCGGGNVGGSCTMEMNEEEYTLFKKINAKAKTESVGNIIEYFEGKMPDELIDRCIENNCDGVLDFHIVEISFE